MFAAFVEQRDVGMIDDQQTPNQSVAYLKEVLLPAAQIIVLVWALLVPQSPWRLLLIIAAFVVVAVGLLPRAKREAQTLAERTRTRRLGSRCLPQFIRSIRDFGEFVDTRQSGTLHNIIRQELSQPVREGIGRLGIPDIQLWYSFWDSFWQRIEQQRPRGKNLDGAVNEFTTMVWQYHNYCVAPIFERLPQELRVVLTAEDRSRLNGFQQQHALFMREYGTLLKALAECHPPAERLPRSLPVSKPL